jgi:predicted Zn-dependent peptidase
LTTVAIALQAGSALESKHGFPLGTAHFLEHFMFKGSLSLSQFEVSRGIAFLGGETNAFTSHDKVVYHITVPVENLEPAIKIFADMIKNPLFPEDELEKERQVILEEYYSYRDDVSDLMRDALFSNFYTNYYKNPIIGTKESIESIQISDLRGFHDSFYKPEHMVISCSSSLKKDDVTSLLEKYFYPNDDFFTRILEQEKSNLKKDKHILVERKELEQSHAYISFSTIPLSSKKSPVLSILSSILGGGMDSRLFQEVREKNNLVYGINAGIISDKKNGMFSVSFSTRHQNLEKAFELIYSELNKISTEMVSEEELQRAKNKLKASLYSSWEDQQHLAFTKVSRFFMTGKLPNLNRIIRKIDSVTLQDIKDVAQQTFSGKKVIIIGKKEGE